MSVTPLMYTRKRRGPRIEPWGTPEETSREEENVYVLQWHGLCFLLWRTFGRGKLLTARPIAIKLSSRFARRIFDGRTSKLIACWYLRVSCQVTKLYSLSCPAQRWSPARASVNRRLWGSKHAIAKRHFPLPVGGKRIRLHPYRSRNSGKLRNKNYKGLGTTEKEKKQEETQTGR